MTKHKEPQPIGLSIDMNERDTWFRAGVDQIAPYMRLRDNTPRDAASPEGQRDLRQGIEQLEAVAKIDPGHWPAFWTLGKAYQSLGEDEESWRCFRRAFRINQDNPDVARELAAACLRLGLGDEAVAVSQHIVEQYPNDPGLIAHFALALLVNSQPADALLAAEHALELDPRDATTQSLLQLIQHVLAGHTPPPTRWPE